MKASSGLGRTRTAVLLRVKEASQPTRPRALVFHQFLLLLLMT